ncbi:hypothetical protein L1F30_13370 [Simiduia sp. 21SJ11W-1]|uniref:hypothetical protein n=1 Tax=Simiduia sp. 21SJ11W-1 TaxID=2909669 RepID=UPI00209D465D|nr:hypothetical protein [Simiduia sp. 21SJ11W-1]UTA47147.1 hypothetical protein L1F30_13370 [Simiduia sp. 21SJ11W-1]
MKNLLILNILLMMTLGCSSTAPYPYQVWSSQETPRTFKVNEPWVLVILDNEGSIKQRLTVKFTEAVADSCSSGDWRVLDVVNTYPNGSDIILGEPAYYLSGAALIVDLSANLCDAGYELMGQLTLVGVSGEHYPVSMFGGEKEGNFYGVPVYDN